MVGRTECTPLLETYPVKPGLGGGVRSPLCAYKYPFSSSSCLTPLQRLMPPLRLGLGQPKLVFAACSVGWSGWAQLSSARHFFQQWMRLWRSIACRASAANPPCLAHPSQLNLAEQAVGLMTGVFASQCQKSFCERQAVRRLQMAIRVRY